MMHLIRAKRRSHLILLFWSLMTLLSSAQASWWSLNDASSALTQFCCGREGFKRSKMMSSLPHQHQHQSSSLVVINGLTEGSRSTGYDDSSALSRARVTIRGGGSGLVPSGWNPFGYKITALGEEFLAIDPSCRDCDVGRFLASMKDRKRFATIKDQWLEVLRMSKSGQSMRIYKRLQDLIAFCLKAGFLD